MSATNSSLSLSASTSWSFCKASSICACSASARADRSRSRSRSSARRIPTSRTTTRIEIAVAAITIAGDVERRVAEVLHEQHERRAEERGGEQRDADGVHAQRRPAAARLRELSHRRMERGRRPEDVAEQPAEVGPVAAPVRVRADAVDLVRRRGAPRRSSTRRRNAGVRQAAVTKKPARPASRTTSIDGYAALTARLAAEPPPSTIPSTIHTHWKSAKANVTIAASPSAATRWCPPL